MSFKAKSRTTYGSEFGFPIHPLQRQSYETPSSSSFVLPSFDDIRTAGKRPLAVMEQPEKKKRTFTSITPAVKPAVLNVCGYARVSTESESQKSSIDIQQQHLMTLASSNDDWEWQGIYCDIISGTRMEKRPELQRMLRDCREGKINLVLTKSISRFARNTTELLETVRSLTAIGVDIIFDRERIDTRSMNSELLLTILASLAESESHSISGNNRWAIQKRFQDGTYRAASAPYGYDLLDGTYAVNEEEAEIVREIFKRCIDGESCTKIAKILNGRGIPTKRAGQSWNGKEVSGEWTEFTVKRILNNTSYLGKIVLQQTYKDQTFRTIRNRGELPMYCIENHHPAIIDKVTFEKATEKRKERRPGAVRTDEQVEDSAGRKTSEMSGKEWSVSRKEQDFLERKHYSRSLADYTFTGKLICAECGSPLIRRKNRVGNIYWICRKHKQEASSCPLQSIPERLVEKAFIEVMDGLNKDENPINDHLERIKIESGVKKQADDLEKRKSEMEKELLDLDRNRSRLGVKDFIQKKNRYTAERDSIQRELDLIKDRRVLQTEELLKLLHSWGSSSFLSSEAARQRTASEMKTSSVQTTTEKFDATETMVDPTFDANAFTSVVDHVVVHSREWFSFHFIGGLELECRISEKQKKQNTCKMNS